MRVSVGTLIEFVLRSGDIDSGGFSSTARAAEGIRLHRKLQKAEGKGYQAEVALSLEIHHDQGIITLEGRADGVIQSDGKVSIDEIKSTSVPLERIDENFNPLHMGQAKCYAYIYAHLNSLDCIDIRLTYCNIEDESVKYITRTHTLAELKEFVYALLEEYINWAVKIEAAANRRQASIALLPFPYPAYRAGQRKMAAGVYKTIKEGKHFFAQAPTGTGKTISALFPALKAMGEDACTKIFYLTAKTIGRKTAHDAVLLLQEKGLVMKSIILTAKEKICFLEQPRCNPRDCPYAKGHFDRVKGCIEDLFDHQDIFSRTVIEAYAERHRVCPFELSLDMSLWSDTIICDYNYVFDPRASLKRFFAESGTDFAFLIDEAHNLPDRAREMFSAELKKSGFYKQKKRLKGRIGKYLTKINEFFIEKRKVEGVVEEKLPQELIKHLRGFIAQAEKILMQNAGDPDEALLELYFQAYAFLKISELYDERYITYYTVEDSEVTVKLFCVDPSYLLKEALKKGGSAVFFSATLTPLDYFKELCGGETQDYQVRLPSPFPQENLNLLIADKVSTRYRHREQSITSVAAHIYTVVEKRKGNYLVFFPSYSYMQAVHRVFSSTFDRVETMVQSGGMSEQEKEHFLALFQTDFDKGIVGFAVLGGMFSEGIDLKGERLSGAVIVGVGLPQICMERDLIKNYFNQKNGMGYEFAYVYPGMNKVLQAAGRVIRSETDTGTVMLIDDRFSHHTYQRLFPAEWNHAVRVQE